MNKIIKKMNKVKRSNKIELDKIKRNNIIKYKIMDKIKRNNIIKQTT